MTLNKQGRKPIGFSLNPNIAKEFHRICKRDGLVGSRQLELMMIKFNEENNDESKNRKE